MKLSIDDRFNAELPADTIQAVSRRQVADAAFSFVTPRVPSDPKLLHASPNVAEMIGLRANDIRVEEFVNVFSGAAVLEGTRPYAMCYGGHQFGTWAGQLGDGRAINLMEVRRRDGNSEQHWTLQLKGAGETPYSRTADGLAVLRSSLREHLCSEAMHYLGVPTSRSLSLITTGDRVMRDVMYDGNPALEPGAVVCRVAPSFIRFGNFELFSSRGDLDLLRQLADYTIRHFFPEVEPATSSGYGEFFAIVCQRTLDMILHWQRVGFVHGVMNTDNMSIHGDTIDYGPYGWLEGFDPNWTPNTTDAGRSRYRYGNQPAVALWNLVRLANALYPLVKDKQPFDAALREYQVEFGRRHVGMRSEKIGLDSVADGDDALLDQLDEVLQLTETDMTIFFRLLADFKLSAKTGDGLELLAPVMDAFYAPDALEGATLRRWHNWFDAYARRLELNASSDDERRARMNAVNPRYVLRNYMAQLAIDKVMEGDVGLIDELYQLLMRPYDEQPLHDQWFAKRPEWARHKVGCSMLSCSS